MKSYTTEEEWSGIRTEVISEEEWSGIRWKDYPVPRRADTPEINMTHAPTMDYLDISYTRSYLKAAGIRFNSDDHIEVNGDRQGMMHGGGGFLVKAQCSDNKFRFFVYNEWNEADTRMQPGDCGEEVSVYDPPDTLEENEVMALYAMGKYGMGYAIIDTRMGKGVFKSLYEKGLATYAPGGKYIRTQLGTHVLTHKDTVRYQGLGSLR